ncbi:DUF6631 family protein [Methyloversatilis sp. XJ19-49]|uniref:DUF6631 family protein n=1 Tax=Methyloversatilis sp. XJ19-49 TaxID=2963429 RepID=UPI00211C7081|nr:DUF6631 family protein [Methyloversatilis sp. XJ19-49]MCQ9378800.1 hypothetical protein [Methyloversatilis sp. XJ19-49]
MNNTEQKPLEAIEPSDIRTVPTSAGDITVEPLRIGQLPAFARAIRQCGGLLLAVADGTDPDSMLFHIAEHGDAIIEACAVATRQDAKSIAALPPDEFIAVIAAVIGVNRDFFARRMNPELLARVAHLAGSRTGST